MCSSPKGSTTRRRHAKRSEFSQLEYEDYARMVQRASAVYDRIEQEKAEKRQLVASQQSLPDNKQKDVLKAEGKTLSSVFSGIKAFLLTPVF